MNRDEILVIAEKMRTYGGSFVKSIGEALMHADPINMRILVDAFPNYIDQYRKFGEE